MRGYQFIFPILLASAILLCGCMQPGPPDTTAIRTSPLPFPPDNAVTQSSGPITANTIPQIPVKAPVNITQPRGMVDKDFVVDVMVPEKIYTGTTLLPDNHDPNQPRIIEVNQLGEIIWEYILPEEFRKYTNPGFDVEPLQNGNVLAVFPRKGVYEINRNKDIVWRYVDPKVSHDADRLPNGNTLVVFGANDQKQDAQVKEVNAQGQVVWSWYAKDQFDREPYSTIFNEGWTHTNAVTRLSNGNTLISPRNFNFLIEVDRDGKTVRTIGEGRIESQHDPEILPNGNILMVNQMIPHTAIEMNSNGEIVWNFSIPNRKAYPVRDANRLENGNTLITGADRIIEVTPDKEIVWQFRLADVVFTDKNSAAGQGFYKATRLPS